MKIHHLAVLVTDMDISLKFWQDALRLELKERRLVPKEGVEIAFLAVGDSLIELIKPLDDLGGLSRQLEQPGTKIHHICLEVESVARRMQQLQNAGIQFVNEEVRSHEDGTRYAFIHPRSTGGVLLELYEPPS